MTTTQKVLTTIFIFITLGLLARYVVFKTQFDNWSEGVARIEEWQTNYKRENPTATKQEMDADFNTGIANIKAWEESYKQEHPGATDSEVDAAFNAQWGN